MNFVKDFWDIIWEVLGWFQLITFINPWEEGIVIQAGTFRRVLKPGWRWHLPFGIDELLTMNVKPAAMELEEQSLTSRDDKKIVCRGVLMWTVFDIKKCFIDVEDAEETLEDISVGVIQEQVEQADWAYIRSSDFRNDMKVAIQKQARKFGISVSTVKFQDLTLAESHRIFGGLT